MAIHFRVTHDAIRFELRGWFVYQFRPFAKSYMRKRGQWIPKRRVVGSFIMEAWAVNALTPVQSR